MRNLMLNEALMPHRPPRPKLRRLLALPCPALPCLASSTHTLNRKGSWVPNLRCTGCPRDSGCFSIQLWRLAPVTATTEGQFGWVPILGREAGG